MAPNRTNVEAEVLRVSVPIHPVPIPQPAVNPGELAINAKYRELGAEKGFLGAAETAITRCPDGVGYFRHFKGGSIYWHPQTGAHEVHGDIRAKWSALGWERSFLGYPLTDEVDAAEKPARTSRFQGGAIYWHPQTGSHEVHGAIYGHYLQLGGDHGFLGRPLTDETGTPDKIGRFNHFEGGSIYWTPHTGPHEVHGDIRARWSALGWERSFLGYPVSDEMDAASSPARVSRFEGGAIYWHPQTGAHEVHGAIYGHYLQLGGDQSFLGRPLTDETGTPDKIGRFNHFEGGSIYWKPSTGAHEVHGLIRQYWAENGWERDPALGYPISDETAPFAGKPSNNRYSDFENGVVYWAWGAQKAAPLLPANVTQSGVKPSYSAAEVLAAVKPIWDQVVARLAGTHLAAGPSYAGVSDYSFDGLTVHNRRYRVGLEADIGTGGFLGLLTGGKLYLEFDLEVAHDPLRHAVVGFLTGFQLKSVQGVGGAILAAQLRKDLDPLLWAPHNLWELPAQASVLSVKVLPNGNTEVYVEPQASK